MKYRQMAKRNMTKRPGNHGLFFYTLCVRELRVFANVDTEKMKAPSFKMVLTAVGKYAYRRQDGIYVVPAGCLKD